MHGTEATAWALLPKDAKLPRTVLVHGATVSSLLSTDKPSAAEHTPSPTATRVVERLGHAQATDRRLSRLGLTALNGRTPHTHSRAHPCLDCCTHFTARENGSANDYIVVESHLDLARCHCRVDAAAAIGNSDHRPVLARIPVAFSSAGSVDRLAGALDSNAKKPLKTALPFQSRCALSLAKKVLIPCTRFIRCTAFFCPQRSHLHSVSKSAPSPPQSAGSSGDHPRSDFRFSTRDFRAISGRIQRDSTREFSDVQRGVLELLIAKETREREGRFSARMRAERAVGAAS